MAKTFAETWWDEFNIGLEYDGDENGANLEITLDNDSIKGDINLEFKTLLTESMDESFDDVEDSAVMEETVIPEYEGMKQYLLECIAMIDDKIDEAKGFVEENS